MSSFPPKDKSIQYIKYCYLLPSSPLLRLLATAGIHARDNHPLQGTATGLGRTTFADSGYHKGRYYKGKIHGWGVMRTADGYEYIGQWKEDEMHGALSVFLDACGPMTVLSAQILAFLICTCAFFPRRIHVEVHVRNGRRHTSAKVRHG